MHIIDCAADSQRPAIRSLLRSAHLPVDDLDRAAIEFWTARHAGELVGVVGVERLDNYGLLRSLAVSAGRRGSGLGQALVRVAEEHARARGLAGLVLLTTTAATFFARRGYVVIPRADAPEAVKRSAEFASICPASAVCMEKSWSDAG